MGKAKKRNFHSCIKTGVNISTPTFSRAEAIKKVVSNIQDKNFGDETKSIISLFGLTPEELAEAGAAFEDLLVLRAVFFGVK